MVSKILKKLPIILILISLSVLANLMMQNSANATCAKTSTGAIITQDISGVSDVTPFALATSPTTFDQDQCSEEPLFYKIKFYDVMLCKNDPYTGFSSNDANNTNSPDFTSERVGCVEIFSGEKEIIIEPGKKVDLLEGDLVLPIGTYKYAAVILSNHLQIKHYQRFADANDADVSIRGYKATGDQPGTACYTALKSTGPDVQFMTTYNNELQTGAITTLHSISLPVADSGGDSQGSNILCNTLAIAKAAMDVETNYAIEVIDHLGDGKYLTTNSLFRNHEAYDTTTIDGILAAQNMLQATGNVVGTTIENSTKLAGYFDFGTTPVVIDEKVTGLTLDFNTSRSVSIDFSVDDDDDKIYGAKVGADPFVLRIIPTSGPSL